MTREEQLACLTDRPCDVCKFHGENGCCKWNCVFEEEPTDAEPCEDAISRADTIEWLKRVTVTDGITFETGFKQILTDIQNMPSVTPKQKMGRWISVSERLPDIHNYTKHYLVTLKRGGVFVAMFTETDGNSWWTYDDVTAWMPIPEPYKSENPTGSNCTTCILDGTDACSRGAGRAVDGRVCEDFVGESED